MYSYFYPFQCCFFDVDSNILIKAFMHISVIDCLISDIYKEFRIISSFVKWLYLEINIKSVKDI